ncbi:MAG: PEP-CTERM sorting domain-containing protein [Colwellia sp.]|nr:PEP-CTERM sorting domain-containing protein [Colwellia sp.]
MNNKLFKSMIAAALLSVTSIANAGIIYISVDTVGAITAIDDLSPENLAGFLLGEELRLDFTFDDSAVDLDTGTGMENQGKFRDSNATLSLTGLTSGATLSYFSGVDIEVDDKEELEIESIATSASATYTRIIGGDIDWNTHGTDFFTNPDNIAIVFADLFANSFSNSSGNSASTEYWNGAQSVQGISFGEVPNTSTFTSSNATSVPEPTSLAILSLGLLGLVSRKVKKS